MPLVQAYKAARRSRRLKGRPEWQDVLPPEKELRDAYAIAARHVNRFSRAFLGVSRGLLTDDVIRRLRAALRDGTVEEAVAAILWFSARPPRPAQHDRRAPAGIAATGAGRARPG